MREKCWETCDQCVAAGQEKCDAAKKEGPCDKCVQAGSPCTKLPKGQVIVGDPVEILSAGDAQDDGSEDMQAEISDVQDDLQGDTELNPTAEDIAEQNTAEQDSTGQSAAQVSPVRDQDGDTHVEDQGDGTSTSTQEDTVHEDELEDEPILVHTSMEAQQEGTLANSQEAIVHEDGRKETAVHKDGWEEEMVNEDTHMEDREEDASTSNQGNPIQEDGMEEAIVLVDIHMKDQQEDASINRQRGTIQEGKMEESIVREIGLEEMIVHKDKGDEEPVHDNQMEDHQNQSVSDQGRTAKQISPNIANHEEQTTITEDPKMTEPSQGNVLSPTLDTTPPSHDTNTRLGRDQIPQIANPIPDPPQVPSPQIAATPAANRPQDTPRKGK